MVVGAFAKAGKSLEKFYDLMAGEDEREGGALLYFGLQTPLRLATGSREVPSPLSYVQQARDRNPQVWIDVEKPFWWDVPVWWPGALSARPKKDSRSAGGSALD